MDVIFGVNKKPFTIQIIKFQTHLLLLHISGPALGRHCMNRIVEKFEFFLVSQHN